MRITNIQNSGFRQQDRHTRPTASQTDKNTASPIPTNHQLTVTQPTEYKRFNRQVPHSSNPFLTQYIDQASQRRTRGFIGRKPAWQAQKSYQDVNQITSLDDMPYLDKSI